MTEKEYIILTNLTQVRDIKGILRMVDSGNCTEIHPEEYKDVFGKITEWEKRLNDKLKVK